MTKTPDTRPATWPTSSVWSIEPMAANQLVAAINSTSPAEFSKIPRGLAPASPMEVTDGVAIIDVAGPLTKRPSVFTFLFDGGSTLLIKEALERAAADDAVKAILLRVDSPGGSGDGLAEAADAIFAARKRKPVVAQTDGMACSAAYHLASQADRVYAQRMDMVGSIGARFLLFDFSGMFEKQGIKAIPIDSGEFKSAGARGTKITDRQVAHFQGIVDSYHADFRKSILRGRRITVKQLDAVADGRVLLAADAKAAGLIDGIQTFEQTFAQLIGLGKHHPKMKEREMSLPANFAELKAACPGADPEFVCSQLDVGATVEAATAAWATLREQRLTAREAAVQATEQRAAIRKPGVDALGGASPGRTGHQASGSDPVEEFNARVRERVAGGMERRKACIAVARADRGLHEEYVRATNSQGAKVQAVIGERFAQ